MNIALFSPNQNPYSETFIQAHKLYLRDKVFYYYGNLGQMQLEGGTLVGERLKHMWWMLKRKLYHLPRYYVMVERLKHSLRHHAIDVILVEYGTHAHHLLPLLKAIDIPFVVHFHGYDASRIKAIKDCQNYVEVFERATKVIAVSRVMEQRLLSLGCPDDKLRYNVYGPRPEFFDVTPRFNKPQFIAIGRFTDKKAPYYTILAFKKALNNYPNATLLMAGDGTLLESCKNLVRFYGIETQVQFLGVITPVVYRAHLMDSLAFVQHSITAADGDMEGTPLAILEASAAGLPVISTYHAGIPDVIIDGVTGLLSKEHEVDAMSRHMEDLLANRELAKTLGRAGKENIKTHFELNRHIEDLQNTLKSAIKS